MQQLVLPGRIRRLGGPGDSRCVDTRSEAVHLSIEISFSLNVKLVDCQGNGVFGNRVDRGQ